ALGALLIPSKSTLGRREMADPKDVESLQHSIPLWIQYVYVIKVERDREQKLLQRLEKEFNENNTIEVITRPSDLNFVRHQSLYWVFHDSNHEIAGWLEEMGCKVKGSRVLSLWELKNT